MKHHINNGCCCDNPANHFSDGSFYSLFVGLNDKCTRTQAMPSKQAMIFVEDVCFGGKGCRSGNADQD